MATSNYFSPWYIPFDPRPKVNPGTPTVVASAAKAVATTVWKDPYPGHKWSSKGVKGCFCGKGDECPYIFSGLIWR